MVKLPPFQLLLDQHCREIHRVLVASVGASDADDVYQETWIAALRAYPKLQDAGNLRAWLLTIAHRKAIDHLRRRARAAVPGGDPVEVSDGAAVHLGGARPAADAASGLTERDPSPWPAVRALPQKQRMAVALRFAADLDYGDVGAAMGISADAARRNVHEGLKKLRQEYSR